MRHKAKNPYREIRALGLVAATWSVDTPSMRFDEARPLCKGSDPQCRASIGLPIR